MSIQFVKYIVLVGAILSWGFSIQTFAQKVSLTGNTSNIMLKKGSLC